MDPAQQRDLTERFLAAATHGDLAGLLDLLAPDVRLVGDSGGKAKAPLRVMYSADKVGRFLAAVAQESLGTLEFRFIEANGAPALLILDDGRPDSVVAVGVADGRIADIYLVRNPDKLTGLAW